MDNDELIAMHIVHLIGETVGADVVTRQQTNDRLINFVKSELSKIRHEEREQLEAKIRSIDWVGALYRCRLTTELNNIFNKT